MKITIEDEVFEKFHDGFKAAILIAEDVDNTGDSSEIHEMLRDVEELIRVTFSTEEDIRSHKMISAEKSAVEHLGKEFHHYQSNVGNMMAEVLEGEEIPRHNRIVDLANFIALKYYLPTGAIDIDKVSGDLHYDLAEGDEIFHTTDEEAEVETNELILRDSMHALSRKFEWKNSATAKVTDLTENVIIHIEALSPVEKQEMERMLDELSDLVDIFSGGQIITEVLDAESPQMEFEI